MDKNVRGREKKGLRERAKVHYDWPNVRVVTFPPFSAEEREAIKRQVKDYANDPFIRELRRHAQAVREGAVRSHASV